MLLKLCIEKTEFCLGLIRLKIVFLNWLNGSVFRISSLRWDHSLKAYGKNDDSDILVRAERVFLLFSLIISFKYFLNQSNLSGTEDTKIEDPRQFYDK